MAFQHGARGQPTDPLKVCPYDKYHIVSHVKFAAHLKNCRRQFQLKQLDAGGSIDMFICQYNSRHVVYEPELLFHESCCSDKDQIYSYQLNVTTTTLHEYGWPSGYDLTAYPRDENEFFKMFCNDELGVVQGANGYGNAIVGKNRNKAKNRQPKADDMARKLGKAEGLTDATGSPSLEEQEEEQDDIAYWNTFSGKPGFDYKASVENPLQSWLRYPPSLTKAERREFEKNGSALWLEEQKQANCDDVQTPSPPDDQSNVAENWV